MPMYSYTALNALASDDTGHFVFLSAWQYNACLSITSQAIPLYFWADDQNPLTPSEIDDLDAKMSEVQSQLMSPLVGLVLPCAAATIPPGTLLCDGAAYLRVDYPILYAALDPAFIVDADNFVVPDLQDRFIIGAGEHDVGAVGGSDEHTMTIDELVPHSHTNAPHAHTESAATGTIVSVGLEPPVPAAVPTAAFTGSTSIDIDSTGGGEPMNILPPFQALRYVVVAL